MDIKEIRKARLRELIGDVSRRGAVAEFSRDKGLDPAYVRQILSDHRPMGEKAARNFERQIGLPEFYFDQTTENDLSVNVSEKLAVMNKVPLISWVSAGVWCEAPDQFEPGDAEDWLPMPTNAGPHAFALRVEGDSMTPPYPGARSYPHGTIIFVDPDRALTNGCRVVAKTPDDHYTFKGYHEDAGRVYLRPINPAYPTIEVTGQVHICGVVVGSYVPE